MSYPYRSRATALIEDFARRYHWAAHSLNKTDPVALARMVSFEDCRSEHVVAAGEVLRLMPKPRKTRKASKDNRGGGE